ncbi:hypothetical protein J437_LFUL004643 [Ladona fulva]|uniref:Reverse transcriptase n=1 Tax=Ladona fulva TaxID=123851 RepID=A0A8K0NX37_LADFU|nr:hypothetical protein J437_LFUL004643 [Ladona fulva]
MYPLNVPYCFRTLEKVNREIKKFNFHGVQVGDENITHLAYADDSLAVTHSRRAEDDHAGLREYGNKIWLMNESNKNKVYDSWMTSTTRSPRSKSK